MIVIMTVTGSFGNAEDAAMIRVSVTKIVPVTVTM